MMRKNAYDEFDLYPYSQFLGWSGDYLELTEEEGKEVLETHEHVLITDKEEHEKDRKDFLATCATKFYDVIEKLEGPNVSAAYILSSIAYGVNLDVFLWHYKVSVVYIPNHGWYYVINLKEKKYVSDISDIKEKLGDKED